MTPQEGSGAIRPLCGGKEQFLLSVQVVPGWLGFACYLEVGSATSQAISRATRLGSRE
jgi:hypothetical protein